MKRCSRCGEEKHLSEFSFKDKAKAKYSAFCRPCVRANSKAHYEANKDRYLERNRRTKARLVDERFNFLLGYFADNPCVDCGESDPAVLDFDHLRDKKFLVTRELINKSWADILAEIEKCVVRCANCHRRVTASQRGFQRLLLLLENR